MLEIREANCKKEQKAFLDFPLELYRGNPYFVPALYGDEKAVFKPDHYYYETCEAVYYNAYRDGNMVGRISGIIQKAYNEKHGEKRARFTRFDAVDDKEVAKALFDAVENWAREKGMDTVCGPLGFSDFEREGLLIKGFDYLSTYEEQYNYEYYQGLIEACGYEKEIDWFESRIRIPQDYDGSIHRLAERYAERYGVRRAEGTNMKQIIAEHGDDFFKIIDDAYGKLYGTVPFTPNQQKAILKNVEPLLAPDRVGFYVDKEGKVVGLGLVFPSISKAVQPSGGHLTPATIVRLLSSAKRPRIIDFGLVAISPECKNVGPIAMIMAALIDYMRDHKIEYAETNLNLEDNTQIRAIWKRFDALEHKQRRSFIKKI